MSDENIVEKMRAEQEAFERWAKMGTGLSLMPTVLNGTTRKGRFPSTYLEDETEMAWRVWANRPTAYSRFWQLVPKNLSDEMYAIVKEVAPRWNAASVWTNLLDAAPAAPIDGEQDKRQPVAWMVPHLVTFKGVAGANCPSELQPDIECTVMWSPSLLGDAPPVVDRHGITHRPYPLKRA